MSYLISHTDDIQQAIISAISMQRVIQLRLTSGWRTVEPYQLAYAQGNEGDVLLYGYCRDMITSTLAPSRWQYFRVSDMKQVEVTNYYFEPLAEYFEQMALSERVTLIAIDLKKSLYE